MLKDMIVEMRQKLDEMVTQFDYEIQLAKDEGYTKGLADGKAGGDPEAKIYSQAEADALADAKVAAALAALPADTTPFNQADVDAKVAEAVESATAALKSEIDGLKLSQAQKDVLEESVASRLKDLASEISALTVVAPAPEPEAPVEG